MEGGGRSDRVRLKSARLNTWRTRPGTKRGKKKSARENGLCKVCAHTHHDRGCNHERYFERFLATKRFQSPGVPGFRFFFFFFKWNNIRRVARTVYRRRSDRPKLNPRTALQTPERTTRRKRRGRMIIFFFFFVLRVSAIRRWGTEKKIISVQASAVE